MLDILIVLLFVAYCVRAGFKARREASRGLEDYFLAGRTLKGWQAGSSMAATQFAADTPLLVMGLIATGGVFLLWQLWSYGIAFLLLGFVFGPLWRRSGVVTDAELTELRYSGRGSLGLRALKAFYFGTVINAVVLAFVMSAALRLAEVFLPWHVWLPDGVMDALAWIVRFTGLYLPSGLTELDPAVATAGNLLSLALLLGFVALYATTGGLRSVVVTDAAQLALALVGTSIYAWIVIDMAGGLGGIGERLTDIYGAATAARFLSFAPPEMELLAPFLVIISLQWLFQMYSDGSGYLAQRAMACIDDREVRVAAVAFAWLQVVLRSLIWLVLGVGLLVVFPFGPQEAAEAGFQAAREATYVQGIGEVLPPGVRGLMLAGMLAALASTVDSHLNWGAGYWSNDLYGRLVCETWLKRKPAQRELVTVARLSGLLILGVAVWIMGQLDSIQEGWKLSLLFGAGIGSVLVMRWLWERITLWSEMAAIAVSLVAGLLLIWLMPDPADEWLRLAAMAALSTAAAVLAALFGPRTSPDTLARFYRQVRPMGFWGATACTGGEDASAPRQRLVHALLLTAMAAASLYLVLAGIGQLLLAGGLGAGPWPWLLLALGAMLTPAWLRGLRAPA